LAAISALLLVALEVAVLWTREPVPGPGPLDWILRVAILHLVILAPSLGAMDWRWSLLPAALALPFVALVSWGHGFVDLRDGMVLLLSAAACGAAGIRLRHGWYLPTVILLVVLPYALGYLCEEFGRADVAGSWRSLSPWTLQLGIGVLLLWVWPVVALAWRRK
jgi:hypothetical protein